MADATDPGEGEPLPQQPVHFASFSAWAAFRFGFFFAMGATLFGLMATITYRVILLWVYGR